MSERMVLNLENLKEADRGLPAAAIHHALKTCVKDCLDRAGESKARKVTIDIVITPLVVDAGDVDCKVSFEVRATLPKYITDNRPYAATQRGELVFNPDAPDNPRQATMPFEEEA